MAKKFIQANDESKKSDPENQPNSLYTNESGLYRLITRSKLPKATKFTDWMFDDLLPKLRKYGKYKLKKDLQNEMYTLSKKINFLEKQNQILKKDIKKEKFPSGGIVYAIDYSTDDESIYRIGMTNNMKLRKQIYNTHSLHKHDVVLIKKVSCPNHLKLVCVLCYMITDIEIIKISICVHLMTSKKRLQFVIVT